MAKTAEIRTKITGDSTGLRRELDVSRSDVARYARDVTARLKAIQAAVQSINIVASVAGFVGIAKQAIETFNTLRKWIRGTSEEAERAAAAATEAARKLRDEAAKAGVETSLYDAIREQADRAGIAADELGEKLKQFREHKLSFDELAASIGLTADALDDLRARAEIKGAGRQYLADRAEAAEKAASAAKDAEAERVGIAALVRDLDRQRNTSAAEPLFDRLITAAGGDPAEAARIYNAEIEARGGRATMWTYQHQINANDDALREAALRYAHRQNSAARDREAAEEAARDAKIDAARKAREADLIARLQEGVPEYNPYQAYAEEQRAAAAAEAQRQREEAAAQAKADKIEKLEGRVIEARWRGQRAEDAVRVSAPSAINSLNTIGGLIGSDPTALNAARMEAERAAAVNAIRESTAAAVRALEEELRILREG